MNNPTHQYLPTTRREFLRAGGAGLGLLAFSAYAPRFLTRAAAADVPAPEKDKRILVLVQLAGGNDGLNTVIPYSDDRYYNLRPKLSVKDKSTMNILDDHLALAPPCTAISSLFKDGKFAIVQNVGYPNPNRSHFRSSEIWETASDAGSFLPDGWVGRYLDNCCSGAPGTPGAAVPPSHDPAAIHSTTAMPQTFFAKLPQQYFSIGGNNANVRQGVRRRRDGAPFKALIDEFAETPADGDTGNFLSHTLMDALVTEKRVQQILNAYQTTAPYTNSQLSQSLKRVASLVAANLETRVYFCSQPGYDTHSNQYNNHQNLLGDLSNSLAAFQKDLESKGLDKQVLTMTFSEFGRRPYENDAVGTDHGTAAPLFVMSGALKTGGLIGEPPDLNIPAKGDLTYKIDFRQVYATVLHRWLDADPEPLLGQKFPELPLLS
jgi:uncharacterized protein (DUF1501 family)